MEGKHYHKECSNYFNGLVEALTKVQRIFNCEWSARHLYKWSVHAGSSLSTLKEGHQIPDTSFFLVEPNFQHGRKLSKRPETKRGLTSQLPVHTAIPRSPRAVAKLLIDGVESQTAGPE